MDQNEELFQIMKYQNERINSLNSYQYLCKNAELTCGCGSSVCNLALPSGYGICLRKMEQVTAKDTEIQNIPTFGICTKTGETCIPSLTEWMDVNTKKLIFNHNTLNNEAAPTTNSYSVCMVKGAMISSKNSGQLVTIEDNKVPLASKIKAIEGKKESVSVPGKIMYYCDSLCAGAYNISFYSKEVDVTLQKKKWLKWSKYKISPTRSVNSVDIKVDLKSGDYRFGIDSDDIDNCEYLIQGNQDSYTADWAAYGGQWFLETPFSVYIHDQNNYSYIEKINYLNAEDVKELTSQLFMEGSKLKEAILSEDDFSSATVGSVLDNLLVSSPLGSFLLSLVVTAGYNMQDIYKTPLNEQIATAGQFRTNSRGYNMPQNGIKFIFIRPHRVGMRMEAGQIVPNSLNEDIILELEPWDESKKTIYGAKYARGRFEKWEGDAPFKSNSGSDLIS